MSPQSEGRPSTDARPADRTVDSGYASQWPPQHDPNESNTNAYPNARGNGYDTSNMPQQRFMGAAAEDEQVSNGAVPASPVDGRNGREREQTKNMTIREGSRGNGSAGRKNSSGTLRLCRKCDEPLTGQFVRALAGTFHLECFKCQVSRRAQFKLADDSVANSYKGLWAGRSFKVLSCRRRRWYWPVSALRNRLLPAPRSTLLRVRRCPSGFLYHCART